MNILFLTPWYPDEANPLHGTFVRDQALALAEHHHVQVICAKIDYSGFAFSAMSRRDSTFHGLSESRLVVKKSLPLYNQFNYFLRVVMETYRIARVFKPDIIHGNIGYPGAFWSWVMSRLLNKPYVVTEHTRITNNFRSLIHKQLALFGLRMADGVVAVSRWHADEIEKETGRKPAVIPNVIRFETLPEPGGYPDTSEFQIGFLGGLNTPVKGLDILLQAASTMRGKFRLHIGGKGKLLEQYRDQAKELDVYNRTIFYEAIPHEEVKQFMGRLHLFVSASRWETFGIAMVEALACGLPVVATDSGGSREFITEANGVIVPVENPDALRKGIETVIANFRSYDPKAISAAIRKKFTTEEFVRKAQGVYASAIEQYNKD